MRYVSISDAKNGLSALVREIRGGATVVITDRGVPVAKLAAISPSTGISAGAIELAQRGRLVLPSAAPSTNWRQLPFPKPRGGKSALTALLDERAESR